MSANGTPQAYLNSIQQRTNIPSTRDRTMEQDNTNSGNPYGYLPQLPGQQTPSQYPTNRYIPPEWSASGGPNGTWSTQGLTYSLPTAYNPYGQGGMPYGPMPYFQGPNGAPQGSFGEPSTGGSYGTSGGMIPSQAGGFGKPGPTPGATYNPGQTQVPPQSGNAQPNSGVPGRPVLGNHYINNFFQPGDHWKGIMPHFGNPMPRFGNPMPRTPTQVTTGTPGNTQYQTNQSNAQYQLAASLARLQQQGGASYNQTPTQVPPIGSSAQPQLSNTGMGAGGGPSTNNQGLTQFSNFSPLPIFNSMYDPYGSGQYGV